jgi:hypothetical protein
MEVELGSLQLADHWRLNAEATMQPSGVDLEINAKTVPSRSLYKIISHNTRASRFIIITFHSVLLTLFSFFSFLSSYTIEEFRGKF